MAAVGQAQAAAVLTVELIQKAALHEGSRLVIAGGGTGHMFDFLNIDLFRPFRLICTDLNPTFLVRLRARLLTRGFGVQVSGRSRAYSASAASRLVARDTAAGAH
jgi:hypothetical protein